MSTSIDCEILEDGTISIQTGDIEEKQHLAADALLDEITELCGGVRNTTPRENTYATNFFKNRKVLLHGKIVKTGS